MESAFSIALPPAEPDDGQVRILLIILIFISTASQAAIVIPSGLTKSDREEALRIVGFGTSNKLLTDPYPLGGYLGLEFGISIENLPAEDLGRLGSGLSTPQADTAFPRISIGKGLYNDIDLFIHFIPYNQRNELSLYGGSMRWNILRSSRIPTSLSLFAHTNTSNISNILTTRSIGLDLVAGLNVGHVSVYMAAGKIQASGYFLGGSSGVTSSGLAESEVIAGTHYAAGIVVHSWEVDYPLFFALEIDRYNVTIFSGRLGLRL